MDGLQRAWSEAQRLAYWYRVLSDLDSGSLRQLVFLELATDMDMRSAELVEQIQNAGGADPAPYYPDAMTRNIVWLARCLRPGRVRWLLAALGLQGLALYRERLPFWARKSLVEAAAGEQASHVFTHNIRAALFGVNDGLVLMVALVLFVAGAAGNTGLMSLIGLVGLLVGAMTMTLSEYFELESQREWLDAVLATSGERLLFQPGSEADMLLQIYRSRGMGDVEARTFALRMMADPELGEEEEDGAESKPDNLNPAVLGDPRQVAICLFFAFILGGALPLLPYMVGVQGHPLLVAMVLGYIALFVTGAAAHMAAGRHPLWGGLRMQLLGAVAGLMAYGAGSVVKTVLI